MVSPVKTSLFPSGCSFCKGRTLYSVVRDTKNTLDINKTRQIAQEIVKVFFFCIVQYSNLWAEAMCQNNETANVVYEVQDFNSHCFFQRREWVIFTLKASCTKTWSPRTSFMTPIKWWSQTLGSLGFQGLYKRGGEKQALKALKTHAWLNCSSALR